MMKTAELAASHEPYKSLWDFSTVTSDNTAEAQNAAIENLLSKGVDAILIDSVSDTSASDVIAKACDAGVLVVAFDSADQSKAPCEYTLEFANHFYTDTAGQWLGKAVGCQGNALLDKGLQGVGIAEAQHQGSVDGLKTACGDKIKVAGEFFGEFGPGPATTALTALAASTPDVTVVSVLTNGDVAFGVFDAAGKPAPALYTYYSNQAGQECLKAGRKCVFINVSMGYGQGAMDVAYRVMGGQDVPRKSDFAYEFLATDTSIDVGVPMTKLEEGKNTWADKPATYNYFFNWPGAVVQLTESEAFGQ
jgi:ribose transport system substrate-binding protein